MQGAPNASAFLTPSHFATGCGARHRFSPSGGAANGMPLKTRTVGWPVLREPARTPVSMRTCSGIIAEAFAMAVTSNATARKHSIRFMCSPYEIGPDYTKRNPPQKGTKERTKVRFLLCEFCDFLWLILARLRSQFCGGAQMIKRTLGC